MGKVGAERSEKVRVKSEEVICREMKPLRVRKNAHLAAIKIICGYGKNCVPPALIHYSLLLITFTGRARASPMGKVREEEIDNADFESAYQSPMGKVSSYVSGFDGDRCINPLWVR